MAAFASKTAGAAVQQQALLAAPVRPASLRVASSCFASAAGFRAACGQKVVVARK